MFFNLSILNVKNSVFFTCIYFLFKILSNLFKITDQVLSFPATTNVKTSLKRS